jgi:eukaryotic-like serine/threonine-protein kinase
MKRDAERWERIQALFHAALEMPEPEQASFVRGECGQDEELATDVLALLEEDARGGSLLDRDLARVAHEMLDSARSLVQQVGPYRVVGVLGEGGMGVVYLAEREDLGSRAAIKMLRDAALSPARRQRFALEQRTLAQLNHPAIARLYDANTLPDGTPYFVMEYVEGVPLTDYCRAHTLSARERLQMFRSVCEAVQFAHRQAVVHRDLKPSNILVTNDGAVKLLDFGIAKQLQGLDMPVDQTQTGLRAMTPAYAAPEQVRGDPIGVYTDVYALGVILYELLAGRPPFDLSNRTPGQAETLILERDPDKPSAAARRTTGSAPGSWHPPSPGHSAWADLDVLCLTAMHKDPQRRYSSVEALIRDIDRYLNGKPLEARPDSVRYRLGKYVRRNWRPLTAVTLVLAAIIGLVIFYTVRLTRARDTAISQTARAQRIQRFMLSLFEGGNADVAPADTLHVVTLVDRGVREARLLDREPGTQAELFETLGGIYQKLGNFDRADSLLQDALRERQSQLGPDGPDVARNLVALGLLRVDQARLEEAERLVRRGLDMSRRHLVPGNPALIRAETALGEVLQARGAYDSSAAVLREAVRGWAPGDSANPDIAEAMGELANTDFYAGDYAASDSLNRLVLVMNQQLYGARHPMVADALINLGAIQFQRGRYPEAEQFYRQALAINQAYYGPNHYEIASDLTMLGRALVAEKHDSAAIGMLQRALKIEEGVYGSMHPAVASTINELGIIAFQHGDLETAKADFSRMLAIYRKVYDGKHYLIGLALSNLASVYLQAKQYDQAEPIFRQAIQMLTETLPAGNMNTAIARIKLGRVLVRERRYKEAEPYLLEGYDALSKVTRAPVSWQHTAREDLVTVYEALNEPVQAARFRAELARDSVMASARDSATSRGR